MPRTFAAPQPVLASAAVVTGGVAVAVVLNGVKAALGLVRFLRTGTGGWRSELGDRVWFDYSAGAVVTSDLRIDWMHVEVRGHTRLR